MTGFRASGRQVHFPDKSPALVPKNTLGGWLRRLACSSGLLQAAGQDAVVLHCVVGCELWNHAGEGAPPCGAIVTPMHPTLVSERVSLPPCLPTTTARSSGSCADPVCLQGSWLE